MRTLCLEMDTLNFSLQAKSTKPSHNRASLTPNRAKIMTKNQKVKFLAQCAADADVSKAKNDASTALLRKTVCDINDSSEGNLIAARFITSDAGTLTQKNQNEWYANAILSIELLEKKGAIFNAKLAINHAMQLSKNHE